jgi:hypothetical protein
MAPGTRDTSDERTLALAYAARLYQAQFDESAQDGLATLTGTFLASASAIYRWLVGPAALFLTIGPILKQGTREPTGRQPGGSPMQLRDNEEVDLTVTVASAKGNEILDQPGAEDDIAWTVDADGVVELVVSENTRMCTVRAVDVGSAVVRMELGELFVTEAFDVIPGEAERMEFTAGAVRKQAEDPEVPEQPEG